MSHIFFKMTDIDFSPLDINHVTKTWFEFEQTNREWQHTKISSKSIDKFATGKKKRKQKFLFSHIMIHRLKVKVIYIVIELYILEVPTIMPS